MPARPRCPLVHGRSARRRGCSVKDDVEVDVAGTAVRLTSLDRVLWPVTGMTKAAMVDYYARVAPLVLPHIARHPITLHRFPEGVDGLHFFQTRAPPHPAWVHTVTLSMPRTGKGFGPIVVADLPSLIWTANNAAIELHPYLGTVEALDRPRALVFDLDPGPPAGFREA